MKKILSFIILCLVIVISLFSLTGCDGFNAQIIDTTYKFDYIYFYDSQQYFEIESWSDFEDGDQLQVKLKNGTKMLVHSSSVALIYVGDNEKPFKEDK